MIINIQNLPSINTSNNDDLVNYTIDIVKEFEGFIGFIYDDGKGIPTIGYGIALIFKDDASGTFFVRSEAQLDDIFDGTSRPSLLPNDLALLNQAAAYLNGNRNPATDVVTDPNNGNVLTTPFHTVSPSNEDPALNVTVPKWTISKPDGEKMVNNFLDSDSASSVTQFLDAIRDLKSRLGQDSSGKDLWDKYENSREGAALLSLYYNSPVLIPKVTKDASNNVTGGFLLDALQREDRVAAWWEIRYNSNGGKFQDGTAKRRYWESAIFGLYDDPTNVSDLQAQEIIKLFNGNQSYLFDW